VNIYLLKDDRKNVSEWIKNTKADSFSFEILEKKCRLPVFYLKGVKTETANILKQTALSVGCDCSIARDVISGSRELSDMMVMCTYSQILKIRDKMKGQPFSLEKIANSMIDKIEYTDKFFVNGIDLLKDKKYLVMGILNLTPDSFYDAGEHFSSESAMRHIEEMLEEGADIIDMGGESTRPSSTPVDEKSELERVLPVLREALKKFDKAVFSVDTYKSNVAEAVLLEGAQIINDISGLNFDKRMPSVIATHKASCILMHIKGEPKNMQKSPVYENVEFEVSDKLSESVSIAIENGIEENSISIDPGIGFGKNQEHNLKLLNNLQIIKSVCKPVCVGVSNKRFIGNILQKSEKERIYGTIGANTAALMSNAKIFRVHNVKENREALKIAEEILYAGN
jgi:dihydropteroate synthase